MKTAPWILMVLLISPMQVAVAKAQQADSPVSGQQQDDSLAAAARKAREQKRNDGKPVKVWDNDHMPTGTINVVGQASTTEDASATAGAAATGPTTDQSKTAPAAVSKEKRANLQAGLESAQQEVESLKSDLDIQQRKYALDQQSYYGQPNYASDKAGAAALDDEKQQLEAKQQGLAEAQKRMDDLQAQLAAIVPPDSK